MIDVDELLRTELDRLAPAETGEGADWPDALRRAGVRPSRRRRQAILALGAAGAALLALLTTPLGAAVVRGVGGFSSWLTGEPGKPAPESVQRELAEADRGSWAAFPETPSVRELIRAHVDGASYTLYGFRAGNAVCLRLAVTGIRGVGPLLACASVSELRETRDLIVPVKGNVGLGAVGPRPRRAWDPPTVPAAIATFGFAAADVRSVRLAADGGSSPAIVANGAFLHVLPRPARGTWVRRAVAIPRRGRTRTIPIGVFTAGQPSGIGLRPPRGPSRVERTVRGGTIGWFVRREPRGEPFEGANLPPLQSCCVAGSFARVIRPDPLDFLRMLVAESDLRASDEVCYYLVTRGGAGGSCAPLSRMFRRGPLSLTWGFSGVGQQFWIASGLASDDVARIVVFLATGERRTAPLQDNIVIVRLPVTKLPARIVGYDREGRVIALETVGRNRDGPTPVPGTSRTLIRAKAENGARAELRVARARGGGSCVEVRFGDGGGTSGCYPKRERRRLLIGVTNGRNHAFVHGRAGPGVAELEIRFADGERATVEPVEGFVLYAVPAEHARDGHRVASFVGRDAGGNVVARSSLRTP